MPKRTDDWWNQFLDWLRDADRAEPLKAASLAENLPEWTVRTTEAVVQVCEVFGWDASALRHRRKRIPVSVSEYFKLDIVAFPGRSERDVEWPLPVAVFELENSASDERVGYSLWKVLCMRADIRMVFAYRRDWDRTRTLMGYLTDQVIGSLSPSELKALEGETVVITGCRGESETFPDGYFKLWALDANLGKFNRL